MQKNERTLAIVAVNTEEKGPFLFLNLNRVKVWAVSPSRCLQISKIWTKNRKIFNPSVPKEWGGSVNGDAIAGGDIFGVQSF